MVLKRLYRNGELEREDVALNELDDLVRQEGEEPVNLGEWSDEVH